MHTWVVSQLCSQHDVMYVSELLKYMCSVCFFIYQVVVCACVQVIKTVACWTISFSHHTLMIHLYNINTPTLVLCMFSFQQPYSFYNINTMLLCTAVFKFLSVTYSLIYYLYDVEIPADWIQTWVDWPYKHVFLSGYYSLWHNYLLTHCYLLLQQE